MKIVSGISTFVLFLFKLQLFFGKQFKADEDNIKPEL